MFKNYLKTTVRTLTKNKIYTLINVAGLALGIVCALAIFLIIKLQSSFDTYHEDPQNIYRVVRAENEFGEINHSPGIPYPLPEALRNDFPNIPNLTIVDSNFGPPVISVEKNGTTFRFKEKDNSVAFVNPAYFKIFKYKWLHGNPETILDKPNSGVISSVLAQKYFGYENPLGKRVTFDNRLEFQVTGVVKDIPQNTDLPFSMLIAYDHEQRGNDNWGSFSTGVQCYLRLSDNVSKQQIESQFPGFLSKYYKKEDAKKHTLILQPLPEMHFDNRFSTFGNSIVSVENLLALGLIGLFLLITACINFVNLNTALAVKRSKEVGVRKVLGSRMSQLLLHFIGETAFITLLAIFVSLALAEVAFVQIESILGYELELNIMGDTSITFFLVILFVFVTLGAGFYPAMHLSRFNPTEAILNKITSRYSQGLSLRKSLVVLQFAISQVLIISTIIIASQMRYFQKADMGFSKEAIVEVELPVRNAIKLHRLKTQLLQQASIKQISFSNTGTASSNSWGGNYKLKDEDQIKEGNAHLKFVDQDFVATYKLQFLAGKGLTPDTLKNFIVNETFAKEVGYANRHRDLLGKYAKIWGREAPIVGIVKDFNTTSLHEKVPPVIMMLQNRYWLAGIKIDLKNTKSALGAIEKAWLSVFTEFVFDYSFLDKNIEKFYEEEQKTANLINTFAIIAIIIGCMGLFGLVSYMAAQRTKEIGIRKVLGANFSSILTLLSKEFGLLIFIAFILAAPIAYYFMNSWLEDFAYRIEIGVSMFFLALATSFLISLVTVGYKSVRAALSNPVEALRYE